MNGKYEPSNVKTATGQIGYGLTYTAAKTGRICTIAINGQLTTDVSAYASLGTIANSFVPQVQVVVPNCAYMDNYVMIQTNGNVALSAALESGQYVQGTYTYITQS